jgi:HK97 gp10 family phage protein
MGSMSDDNSDFDAYLNSLPDKLVAELSGVVREQAEMLSDAQRQAAIALEETSITGGLQESCIVVPTDDPLAFTVQAGGQLTTYVYDRWTDYESEVVIDGRNNEHVKKKRKGTGHAVTFDHAVAFEFGTSHQHAKPFFWPTYRAKRGQIEQAISLAVEKALK